MTDVGFIGLGTMGGPMAMNVLKKGHRLTVFDVSPKAVARLTAAGARSADSPRAVAAASDVVITMLPDAPDVERVALGADGIAAGIRPGAIYIDMSTVDPDTTQNVARTIAAKGAHMIDSPVGKTAEHAVSGTLTLMVGGPQDIVARARPVLDCMGTDFIHCGALGMGHAMKIVNNLLATTLLEINSEVLAAGIKAGLTLDTMTAVMQKTMAWNNQLAVAMPARPFAGDFAPGFMLKLAHKDCRLALTMIRKLGLAAPVGEATLAACADGIAQGAGENDVGVLLKLREERAGVTVRKTKP
ncbi:MAG: NAD(P)-dependent oxidoreductase [Alphaproteobacteria bacterium]|nr:NAD(P)-dependent oxidoreductase [Alphaproteobacteria bacterium]